MGPVEKIILNSFILLSKDRHQGIKGIWTGAVDFDWPQIQSKKKVFNSKEQSSDIFQTL